MQIIPIAAMENQRLGVVLGNQNCTITVAQKSTGMFLGLEINQVVVMTGVLCTDRTKLVRQSYLGMVGDLAFMDTQGREDPLYEGLGTRWVLMYLEASDLSN